MDVWRSLTQGALTLTTDYLGFVLGQFSLEGLESFRESTAISTTLFSYFVIGTSLAFLLAKGEGFPGCADASPSAEDRASADKTFVWISLLQLCTATAAVHFLLFLLRK